MANYLKIKDKNIRLPGLRNIKTAIAVYLCIILYYLLNLGNPIIALFSVVICMQQNISQSLQEGKNRILGTFYGGAFGVLFRLLHLKSYELYIWSAVLALMLIFIIYTLNILKRSEAVSNCSILFLLIALDNSTDMLFKFAFIRMIDTIIGIVIAISVNRFIFPPKQLELNEQKNLQNSKTFNDVEKPNEIEDSDLK